MEDKPADPVEKPGDKPKPPKPEPPTHEGREHGEPTPPHEPPPHEPPPPRHEPAGPHKEEPAGGFSPGKLIFGILVLLIGVYFLVKNLGLLPESFDLNLWQLWPVIIIAIGLSMLTSRKASWIFGIIAGVIVLAIIAFLVWAEATDFQYSSSSGAPEEYNISHAVADGVTQGTLHIDTGAAYIALSGGSDQFIDGRWYTNLPGVESSSDTRGNTQTVKLYHSRLDDRPFWFVGDVDNDMGFGINSTLPMTIDMDTGAADMEFDFRDVTLEKFILDTGASEMDLIMGDNVNMAEVTIDAGVSTFTIHLPEGVGARAQIDSGITAKEMDGFTKIDDGVWETGNYESADKKIVFDMDLGVSDLEFQWYDENWVSQVWGEEEETNQ